MQTVELINEFIEGKYRNTLLDIYVDENVIDYQQGRYVTAIKKYESLYGQGDVKIYSAPGRSEVGGNHTDHQHGQILAASINLDAIAVVEKNGTSEIRLVSDGYDEIIIDTADLSYAPSEKESTVALVKGVLAGMKERGYQVGGFSGYITSDVLIGAGLSSSAAFETLIGTIESYLYNDGKLDPVTNAIIGQYAENVYFGKPCGLMDQMACSVGNLVHVDFACPGKPLVNKVGFDMNEYGYSLCITDTKGSHADLTADYAAVPFEMKQVAAFFGKDVLLGITMNDLLRNIVALRQSVSDRAVLRAIHFVQENDRVAREVSALNNGDIDTFLEEVKASGNSSYKYLQNVYSNSDINHQNVSLALAVSESVLAGGKGVCRVHGGGFAGTIQAFVRNDDVAEYVETMNSVFGESSCKVLKIRKYGGISVV